jgi:hypothetical protein
MEVAMRVLVVAIAFGLAVTSVSAQQGATQYLTHVKVWSGSGSAIQVVAEPTFRTRAGSVASMDLAEPTSMRGPWIQLRVTPEPLDGKVLLHVSAATPAQPEGIKFDILTGSDILTPMIALRADSGAWLVDKHGHPMFIQLRSEAVRR